MQTGKKDLSDFAREEWREKKQKLIHNNVFYTYPILLSSSSSSSNDVSRLFAFRLSIQLTTAAGASVLSVFPSGIVVVIDAVGGDFSLAPLSG